MVRPLTANHALLRANITSGKAQIQYHGFWVGDRSQNQAKTRNAAWSQIAGSAERLARQTRAARIVRKARAVRKRAVRKAVRDLPG